MTHLVNMYDLCTQDALIGPLFEGSHLSKDNGFMLFFFQVRTFEAIGLGITLCMDLTQNMKIVRIPESSIWKNSVDDKKSQNYPALVRRASFYLISHAST